VAVAISARIGDRWGVDDEIRTRSSLGKARNSCNCAPMKHGWPKPIQTILQTKLPRIFAYEIHARYETHDQRLNITRTFKKTPTATSVGRLLKRF